MYYRFGIGYTENFDPENLRNCKREILWFGEFRVCLEMMSVMTLKTKRGEAKSYLF